MNTEELREEFELNAIPIEYVQRCVDITNQRVIEELESQMELAQIGNSYTRLRDRVKELKTK